MFSIYGMKNYFSFGNETIRNASEGGSQQHTYKKVLNINIGFAESLGRENLKYECIIKEIVGVTFHRYHIVELLVLATGTD